MLILVIVAENLEDVMNSSFPVCLRVEVPPALRQDLICDVQLGNWLNRETACGEDRWALSFMVMPFCFIKHLLSGQYKYTASCSTWQECEGKKTRQNSWHAQLLKLGTVVYNCLTNILYVESKAFINPIFTTC